jgi:hypothetical protein
VTSATKHVEMTKQNLLNYSSHSLTIKDRLVQGHLLKKSSFSSIAMEHMDVRFKKDILMRYYHVDFGRNEFTWRQDYHPKSLVKLIKFKQILTLSFMEDETIVYKKGTHESKSFGFPFRIKVSSRDKDMILYARTAKERELWV